MCNIRSMFFTQFNFFASTLVFIHSSLPAVLHHIFIYCSNSWTRNKRIVARANGTDVIN